MLLACRFVVDPADAPAFADRARRALTLLSRAPGAQGGQLARAVDDPAHWVLEVRFASVDAYRRALSPFDVREHVVPLLSEAETDTPSTYETLAETTEGGLTHHTSLRAD